MFKKFDVENNGNVVGQCIGDGQAVSMDFQTNNTKQISQGDAGQFGYALDKMLFMIRNGQHPSAEMLVILDQLVEVLREINKP